MPIIYIFIAIVLFILIIDIYEMNHFKISNISVNGKANHRFAVISDVHSCSFGKDNEKLLNALDSISPDFVVITGDMLNGHKNADILVAGKLVCDLSKKYRVYYGLGNHESRLIKRTDYYGNIYVNYMKYIEDNAKQDNLYILDNERTNIGKNTEIFGLTIDNTYYMKRNREIPSKEYVIDKLGQVDNSKYNIMIAHNPEYAATYAEYGANLVLSGHVHGGTVRLPIVGGMISTRFTLFPKYTKGLYKLNNDCNMIVSPGLGTHTIKLRLFNMPEIVVVTTIS